MPLDPIAAYLRDWLPPTAGADLDRVAAEGLRAHPRITRILADTRAPAEVVLAIADAPEQRAERALLAREWLTAHPGQPLHDRCVRHLSADAAITHLELELARAAP